MCKEDLIKKEVLKSYIKEKRGYNYNISRIDDFGCYMRFYMETYTHNKIRSIGSLHINKEDYLRYLREYKLNLLLNNSQI
jgi:hypothetical protein